jgi:hypothetical protein
MGQVQGDMIELYGPLIRHTGGLREPIDLMAAIFEERDHRSLPHVEYVALSAAPRLLRAQKSAVASSSLRNVESARNDHRLLSLAAGGVRLIKGGGGPGPADGPPGAPQSTAWRG